MLDSPENYKRVFKIAWDSSRLKFDWDAPQFYIKNLILHRASNSYSRSDLCTLRLLKILGKRQSAGPVKTAVSERDKSECLLRNVLSPETSLSSGCGISLANRFLHLTTGDSINYIDNIRSTNHWFDNI